ncbi:hypothetical protein [Hydrogenovibrio marinus]|uniref:Uncharacterized protein n=1 Tax=Hydrogenovibrio marinus TaxID=28885 RepID=A0A066ZXL0_HYDMR|nr:hypothetical protein [Hydrogenovibrio marinus]KDN94845.1 hypothetical protein EI16_00585 [Hydrogenovibrio marinus]BBN59305.1 hypothetical protein HVMH_0899 [Hydrogenovibrio marinus]
MAVDTQEYTLQDYRNAVEKLFPPGKYWEQPEDDSDLDNLYWAIAQEWKTTADELKTNILFGANNTLFGWKISDYQRLLDENGIDGTVFDDKSMPSYIYFNINNLEDSLAVFNQVNELNLSNIRVVWMKTGYLGLIGTCRTMIYRRLEAIEAPYSGGIGFEGFSRPMNFLRLTATEAT